MTDITEAIDEAVDEAQATFDDADKSPIDHGYASVRGLDGRTKLASALESHDDVDVQTGGYHGTTVTVDGVNRYFSAQRGALDVFIKTLQSHGVDAASDLHVGGQRN